MRWYLPDRHPIFWHEVRRRLLCMKPMHPLLRLLNQAVRGLVALLLLAFSAFLTYVTATADAGPELFWTLLAVQMVGLGMACPSISTWVFAEEREKGTFDVLLSLPIRSRSIVLQKFTYLSVMALMVYFVFLAPSVPTLLTSPYDWLLGYAVAFSCTGCFLACGVLMGCLFRYNWLAAMASYGTAIVLTSGMLAAILTTEEVRDGLFRIPAFLYTVLSLSTLLFVALTILFLTLAVRAIDRLRELKRN